MQKSIERECLGEQSGQSLLRRFWTASKDLWCNYSHRGPHFVVIAVILFLFNSKVKSRSSGFNFHFLDAQETTSGHQWMGMKPIRARKPVMAAMLVVLDSGFLTVRYEWFDKARSTTLRLTQYVLIVISYCFSLSKTGNGSKCEVQDPCEQVWQARIF